MGVLGVGNDLVALLAGETAGRDEVLVGVDQETQQRGAPRGLVGLEDVELLGRGEVVGLELDVEIEGRVVDARRRMLGGGRAVDRGHRQKAILEGALQRSRSPVGWERSDTVRACRSIAQQRPGDTSVVRPTSSPTQREEGGGGRGGRRSRG